MKRRLSTFLKDDRAAIAVFTALLLPALLGLSALGTEYGASLSAKAEEQRNADLAAYAAALAYNSTNLDTSLNPAAQRIALLNGRKATEVNAVIVTSPRANGNSAVAANMAISHKLYLAPILGISHTVPINTRAVAEVGGKTEACIQALAATGGVTMSGAGKINAPKCGVASNTTVTVPCGTEIITPSVTYNSATAPSQPCTGIKAASGSVKISKAATTDGFRTLAAVTTATARIASPVRTMTSPAAPAVPGLLPPLLNRDIEFPYYNDLLFHTRLLTLGCTGTFASNTWTVNCNALLSNILEFGRIKVGSGLTVKFLENVPANSIVRLQSIENGGVLSIGRANITMQIAKVASCGSSVFSICNTGTLTLAGPSTFQISGGIYGGGQSKVTLGTGTTNVTTVGSSTNGYSLFTDGSGSFKLGDTTTSPLKLVGNIATSAGGCADFGTAEQHDILGFLNAQGGVILGAGIYTIDGYAAFGAAAGGNVTCDGVSTGIRGNNVTLVLSGKTTASANCAGFVFCVAAGYSSVILTAPASKLAIIGPTSAAITGGATLNQGASNASVSGAIYFPNGPLTLSGGASIGGGTGQCLQIAAARVSIGAGTAAGSTCISGIGGGSGSGATVVLVQ
jgi:Flp pilus assembly protein TadG